MSLNIKVLFGIRSLVRTPAFLSRTPAFLSRAQALQMADYSPITQLMHMKMVTSIKAARLFQ